MTTFYRLNEHRSLQCTSKFIDGRGYLLTLILWFLAFALVYAQTFPTSFTQTLVANSLDSPTALAFAPDGRIFVTQQGGALRVIKNGALLPTPFVSLTVDAAGERGLIGIVLDPAFSTNHFIYLYHTVPGTTAHNRISRYTANGDVVLAGSELTILELDPLSGATNHNGGAMAFGKDGKLYVGVGENANGANAQNLATNLGKILRINADGSLPADNPFQTGPTQTKQVWAYGLRNPYTIAIQPVTGRIFVNDVGQSTWEEINDATMGGLNFGWPTAEGFCSSPTCSTLTNPVFVYPHGANDGSGCAITGGTFFNPTTTNYPASYIGKYFYQDFCNNWINFIDLSSSTAVRSPFATGLPSSSLSISTGLDGNVYYLSMNTGALYKLIYTPTVPDLSPTLMMPQSNFAASGTVSNFVLSLFETNGFATTPGTVAITATAPVGYTLAFSPSITSINVSGGGATTVSNANWTVTNTVSNRQISLVMKPGLFIGANSTVNLGFSITRTSASAGSTSSINVNVTNDTSNGYDSNVTNNVYARIISGL